MKYGLIGEKLGHSFSAVIHSLISDYEYILKEVPKEEIVSFIKSKDFSGINVTIPYKETVIPYLDYIDDGAREIGAVNTIVNRQGRLYGYNTDYYGMKMLFSHLGVDPRGKKAVILGSGGTSKTATSVLKALGASEIIRVSRSGKNGSATYDELYEKHTNAEIIVNTTPVGMYPDVSGCAVDIARFTSLKGVIDAVYNPLRTKLVTEAKIRGIAAEGGLYMLVAQAVRACEIFLDTMLPDRTVDSVYASLKKEKENIVLIGMPASGKSTVGASLSAALGRELIDTDSLIVDKIKMSIKDFFSLYGEEKFREVESEVIAEVSVKSGVIIATGGGAVLREKNISALKQNGKIFFLDRSLDLLLPTSDRPLSSNRESIERRYNERYEIYLRSADERIISDGTIEDVTKLITEKF